MKWFALVKERDELFIVDLSEKEPVNIEQARILLDEIIKEECKDEIKVLGIFSEWLEVRKLSEKQGGKHNEL
jgi:hypothetical protein